MAHTFILPEILAAVVEEKLGDKIKLYPLAKKESLNGKAGDTITIPTLNYIGVAGDVPAGTSIPLADFTQASTDVKVKKVGKALKFTEEEIINHYIDLQGEAEKQLTKAMADKIEVDLFAELDNATMTAKVTALDVDGLADAVVPFGEELDEEMYLFVNPKDLALLRKDEQFIVNANHGEGEIKSAGMIFGMEVVVSNRVPENTAYVIKDGAVAIYMRKGVDVEMDKNILDQTHIVAGTVHYAVALNDASKVVKVTVGA